MEVILGSRGREFKSRQPDQSDLAHPDVVGLRSTDILATLDDAAADSDRRTRSAIPAASVDAYASLLTIEVKAAGGGDAVQLGTPYAFPTLHPSPSGADVVAQAE
jgi:hypothetical protein